MYHHLSSCALAVIFQANFRVFAFTGGTNVNKELKTFRQRQDTWWLLKIVRGADIFCGCLAQQPGAPAWPTAPAAGFAIIRRLSTIYFAEYLINHLYY